MSHWPVFLTATEATLKTLNKAFLLLRDFEFSEPNTDSQWVLLTSSDVPSVAPKPISPPLDPITENAFANKSPVDINKFVRINEEGFGHLDLTTGNWVIIDQEGLDNGTCIVANQTYDDEAMRMTSTSKAVRVPWPVAWSLFANLDLGNMDFEEWVDEDAGVQTDGLYKWVGPFPHAQFETERQNETKRDAALKVLRGLGHVD